MTDTRRLRRTASAGAQPLRATTGSGSPHPADRVVASIDLLAGDRRIWIEHAGAYYRLQVTTANKLILTK